MNEQEAIRHAASTPGAAHWLLGAIATACSGHLALLYRKHDEEIKDMKSEIERKADKKATDETIQRIFDQMREDRQEVVVEVRKVGETVNAMNTKMLEELGKRPTREELLQNHKRGNP